MKLASDSPKNSSALRLLVSAVLSVLLLGAITHAQNPQLSLADLLIGLRSKKVSLQERNTILTEAVRQRGVTFVLTPEIEKELQTTGASVTLVEAIRQKGPKPAPVVAVVKPVATPVPTPVPTPTPPDFTFYQTRADQNAVKGEFSLALADYTKSLEMKSDNAPAYVGRGRTHYNLKSFDLSVKDFDRAVELNPKDAVAFLNRGVSHEKMGDDKKAINDYQKALELDPASETAKANLKRLQDAQAAAAAAEAAKNTPPAPAPPPAFVYLGNLTAANATRMITPVYTMVAQRANVEGKVTVDIELDEDGNVVSAKATSGHQMLRGPAEDAANRSKFKPATYNDRPIKGKGTIIYNFSLRAPR